MKISAVNVRDSRSYTGNMKASKTTLGCLSKPLQQDTVSFKGIKNAARMGGLYSLAGLVVGALFLPGLGPLIGALTMGSITASVGAVAGLMEDDKENILKQ